MSFHYSRQEIEQCIRSFGRRWSVRQEQVDVIEEALEKIQTSDVILLDLPTASGKQLIGMVLCRLLGIELQSKSTFITAENILLDQLQSAYSAAADNRRGIGASICLFNPSVRVDPNCRRVDCPHKMQCSSSSSENNAILSTNYHWQISHTIGAKPDDKPKAIILDECHQLEHILTDLQTIRISPEMIERSIQYIDEYNELAQLSQESSYTFLATDRLVEAKDRIFPGAHQTILRRIPRLTYSTVLDLTCQEDLQHKVEIGFHQMVAQIRRAVGVISAQKQSSHFKALFADYHRFRELAEIGAKWETFANRKPDDYVVSLDGASIILEPIVLESAFAEYFLNGLSIELAMNKVILMSATPGDVEFIKKLYNLDKLPVVHRDPIIPEKVQPIVYISRNSRKTSVSFAGRKDPKNLQSIKDDLESALHHYSFQYPVVVHTASFIWTGTASKVFERLFDRAQHVHSSGKVIKAKVLDNFSRTGGVIYSPSMTTGVDFIDDLARTQVLLKLPTPPLTCYSLAKNVAFPGWQENQKAISLVQTSGRSTRHMTDTSTVFIIDHSITFLKKYLPKTFQKRIQVFDPERPTKREFLWQK